MSTTLIVIVLVGATAVVVAAAAAASEAIGNGNGEGANATATNSETTNTTTSSWSCNVINDTCPLPFLYNGICQQSISGLEEECGNGDCYDCDPCRRHRLDCHGCLSEQMATCYWCPYDGACYGSPYYPQVFGLTPDDGEACLDPSDYETTQCTVSPSLSSDGEEGLEVPFAFSDPLYNTQQWVFDMINVRPVWEKGYRGTGVKVRINDNGVDADHPEFEGRFDVEASCEQYLAPTDRRSDDFHGTSVAGIIGAAGNNDVCSVGIAPGVSISSCNILDYQNMSLAYKIELVDVSNNSWGVDGCRERGDRHRKLQDKKCPFTFVDDDGFGFPNPCEPCEEYFSSGIITPMCERAIVNHCNSHYKRDSKGCLEFLDLILGGKCEFFVIPDRQRDEILTGIEQGRDRKGTIFVFAAGNALKAGDHTNFQPYTNSRFVISVAGVSKRSGRHASYSTPGPGIFVSAPGGDVDSSPNHVTADLGGGCRDARYATSLAAAVVSGVIALMLEANPDLTWRDVQSILTLSSRRVDDDPLDKTAVVNAAGLWHSEWYGFGIVDAENAVDMAENWVLLGEEEMVMADSGEINIPLGDGPSSSKMAESTLTLGSDNDNDFIVTTVVVYLDLVHSSRGHLKVTLTSPQGTESVLLPGERPENTQVDDGERWKLLTLRSWGEKGNGDWLLSIADTVEGDVANCVDLPWVYTLDGIQYDCYDFEQTNPPICQDGILDPYNITSPALFVDLFKTKHNGVLATQACCQCGGGNNTSTFPDRLYQWRLVAYGQNQKREPSQMEEGPSSDQPFTAKPYLSSLWLVHVIVFSVLWSWIDLIRY
jgi:subtilisin family serine protease